MRTLLFSPTPKSDPLLDALADTSWTRIIYAPDARAEFRQCCAKVHPSDVVIAFSRAARWLAEENVACAGAVFLGFPFHEKGNPKAPLGQDALLSFTSRVLVLQGERDPYGSAHNVKRACAERLRIEVCAIANGNHRFFPKEKSGLHYADSLANAQREISNFIASL